jgi:prevent-host-death family protein
MLSCWTVERHASAPEHAVVWRSTGATLVVVALPISQRELRNDSGDIMRRVEAGESFVVTRNGVPVGELVPIRPRRFVPAAIAAAAFAGADPDSDLLGELGGTHATADPDERARRQGRLQRAEATFDALPFDDRAARASGRIYARVTSRGRKARGRRALDLLVAATALSAGAPSRHPQPRRLLGTRRADRRPHH